VVELDRYSLKVGGRRLLLRAGSLHYFRLPARSLWRERIAQLADAGLNAVDVYYPWNFHSEAPGEFDFTELRDIDHLHDLIEAAGLYLIARPGPYICAELDFGGLPAWLLRDPSVVPRCRTPEGEVLSRSYLEAVHSWFAAVVPRIAARKNLVLFQIENEYSVPAPLAELSSSLADLLVRWLGARRMLRLASLPWLRRAALGAGRKSGPLGQHSPYLSELYRMARSLGVRVPIFHNDLQPWRGRQLDVDLLALDRYPITSFGSDWRDDPKTFDEFAQDERALAAHRADNPVFYPELQAGWFDGWGGSGYAHIRERLGAEGIDGATKAALAARATLWNYYVFCGGVTFGYQASPDVYSSYDYGAPISESGAEGTRFAAVKRLNEFLAPLEADLARTELEPEQNGSSACFATRVGEAHRYAFLRNPTRQRVQLQLQELERASLAPWETQIRVYDKHTGGLLAVSPELPIAPAPQPVMPPALPRLERWRCSSVSPQLAADYDAASWLALDERAVQAGEIDLDSLGFHYGFVWYRGTFTGPLDRLLLDARHCWAVWLNGERLASGDQFRNPLGVGADGARVRRVSLRRARLAERGHNTLVILVESLGHNKVFADDGANPRGIVSLDTGTTRVAWRARGGLVRGERGIAPVVSFARVERAQPDEEVILPHGWLGAPEGVALYETSFRLEGIDPKHTALALAFDPGQGKANLYLNGLLLGRYWPERGPQRRFPLPWGLLSADDENQLAVALWKRGPRAALGKLRLELA
jgi:hypothetical protein